MNPLIVIALVGGVIAWLMSGRKKNTPPLLAIASPINTQPGITTGFPGVPIDPTISPVPSGTQANNPATASSGIPNSAAPVVNVSQAPTQPTGATAPQSPFYDTFSPFQNGMYTHQAPIAPVLPFAMPEASCGCGGGCKGGGGKSTSCSSARAAALNDCLAPAPVAQLKNTPLPVFAQWASNVASSPHGMFSAVQNIISNTPGNSEHDSQANTPASPFLTPIGVGPQAPYGY